jgi:hypothetical protein
MRKEQKEGMKDNERSKKGSRQEGLKKEEEKNEERKVEMIRKFN